MNEPLLVLPDAPQAADPAAHDALDDTLRALAGGPIRRIACRSLVQCTNESRPAWIVARLPDAAAAAALVDALRGWNGAPPCPLVALGAALPAALHAALAEGGVHAWAADDADAGALGAALARAQARAGRERALHDALAAVRAQLDERKWIERAKGLLMSARGLGEDDAFRLLRGAAMHANLKLGEVSRSVVEAAQWADAINRAGQLRMLSQRLARLTVQSAAGIEPRGARALRDESIAHVQRNLDQLAALAIEAPAGAALQQVHAAWQALQLAIDAKAPRGAAAGAALETTDALAESLHDAAEALVGALEAAGARRALHIVNVCGRQRMRVQRLAKDALLAMLLPGGAHRARLAPTIAEFDAALLELERAPLSSPEIRDALAAARADWQRLVRSAQGTERAERAESAADLVRASDALVQTFDALTASYEHSLQVVMS